MTDQARVYISRTERLRKSGYPVDLRDASPSGPVLRKRLILQGVDLAWSDEDREAVRGWWVEGISSEDMAVRLKRDQDEVELLLWDLARTGQIERRPGGVWGGMA